MIYVRMFCVYCMPVETNVHMYVCTCVYIHTVHTYTSTGMYTQDCVRSFSHKPTYSCGCNVFVNVIYFLFQHIYVYTYVHTVLTYISMGMYGMYAQDCVRSFSYKPTLVVVMSLLILFLSILTSFASIGACTNLHIMCCADVLYVYVLP